jgi:hypothetical protein
MKDCGPVSTYLISMFSCSSSLLAVDFHCEGFITAETNMADLFRLFDNFLCACEIGGLCVGDCLLGRNAVYFRR